MEIVMASMHPPRRHTVAPVNVSKLMAAIGPTQAAARLSVSTTLLHKAKKDNTINQVVEMAAAHALGQLDETTVSIAPVTKGKQPDAVFMLAVPADKADVVRRVASAMDADLVCI